MARLTDADAEALQKDISPTLADLAEDNRQEGERHGGFRLAHRRWRPDGDSRCERPLRSGRRRRSDRQGRGRRHDGQAAGLHRDRPQRRALPEDAAAVDDRAGIRRCAGARAGDAALPAAEAENRALDSTRQQSSRRSSSRRRVLCAHNSNALCGLESGISLAALKCGPSRRRIASFPVRVRVLNRNNVLCKVRRDTTTARNAGS